MEPCSMAPIIFNQKFQYFPCRCSTRMVVNNFTVNPVQNIPKYLCKCCRFNVRIFLEAVLCLLQEMLGCIGSSIKIPHHRLVHWLCCGDVYSKQIHWCSLYTRTSQTLQLMSDRSTTSLSMKNPKTRRHYKRRAENMLVVTREQVLCCAMSCFSPLHKDAVGLAMDLLHLAPRYV